MFFTGHNTSLRLLGGSRCSRKKTGPKNNADGKNLAYTTTDLGIDFSVRVAHLERKEIIKALKEEKGLVREDINVSKLRTSLAKVLKNKLKSKVELLSTPQLRELCGRFSLHEVLKRGSRARYVTAITKHLVNKHPDSPLGTLKLELNGGYAQNTGKITCQIF